MWDWVTLERGKDVALFALAIYGAALSTFNWRQAVRKDKRAVSVKLSTTIPAYDNGSLGPCFAKLEVTNVGHRPVTISTMALELPGGARIFCTAPNAYPGISDTRLPATLSDGASASIHFAYQDISAALANSGRTGKIKVVPACEDSSGTYHRGKHWEVDTEQFARM